MGVSLRRKNIAILRSKDYRKFERLTDIWCEELQKHRLTAYRRKLEDKQPDFLRKKAEKLREILDIEKKYGFTPTVSESDISDCLNLAAETEAELTKAKEAVEKEDYLVYKEEAVRE